MHCKTCRFFNPMVYHEINENEVTGGECRFWPPVAAIQTMPLMLPNDTYCYERAFPMVIPGDYCGQYKKKQI